MDLEADLRTRWLPSAEQMKMADALLAAGFDAERPGVGRERGVYTVHILNTKTTYQFTRHFFLRAIAQFDDSKHQVLTDFLSSYELRPGTVFYIGYGSLIEQRAYQTDPTGLPLWQNGIGSYQTVRRGLFVKASYLLRF